MVNMENKKTVITFEVEDRKMRYELSWDVSMEQLIDVFYSGCIGMTFHPTTIMTHMRDYAEAHLDSLKHKEEDYD